MVIQAYDTEQLPQEIQEKRNFSRARTKRETQDLINEYYESLEDTKDGSFERDD